MKVIIAATAGWICFYLGDQALFGGRLVQSFPDLAKALVAAFGFYS
jgi:hypothetical protein